jgi:hypothetical protein
MLQHKAETNKIFGHENSMMQQHKTTATGVSHASHKIES